MLGSLKSKFTSSIRLVYINPKGGRNVIRSRGNKEDRQDDQ